MIHEIHPTTGVIHVNWRRRAVDKSSILGLELGFVRLVGLWFRVMVSFRLDVAS